MQTRDFCFWLQGLLEVGKVHTLDAEQVSMIKTHLDLVFRHADDIKQEEMAHPAPVTEDNGTAIPSPLSENPAFDLVRTVKYPPLFEIAEPSRRRPVPKWSDGEPPPFKSSRTALLC